MNWKLDTVNLYVWTVDSTPFGVEKIDNNLYVPFRLWSKSKVYVTNNGDVVSFSSRREAMRYVEKAVREYQERIVVSA